jgi:hypothetical protein
MIGNLKNRVCKLEGLIPQTDATVDALEEYADSDQFFNEVYRQVHAMLKTISKAQSAATVAYFGQIARWYEEISEASDSDQWQRDNPFPAEREGIIAWGMAEMISGAFNGSYFGTLTLTEAQASVWLKSGYRIRADWNCEGCGSLQPYFSYDQNRNPREIILKTPCVACGGTFGYHAYEKKNRIELNNLIYKRNSKGVPILTPEDIMWMLGHLYELGAFDAFKSKDH